MTGFIGETAGILVMLGILSVLIIVHEIGHFSVARFFGFQTPVFGFGLPFGPSWVVGKKWNTEFRFHAFIMGGYVAIPELGDESSQSEEVFGMPLKPFRKFPIWKRALVAFAGVAFNIIFAYLVMLTMFLTVGQPSQPTVVYSLPANNPIAANAGVKTGDTIVAVDGHEIASPDDIVGYLSKRKGTQVHLDILRDKKPLSLDLTTNDDGKVGMALISKGPLSYTRVEGNIFQIAYLAHVKLWTLTWNMISALGQLLGGALSGSAGAGGEPAVGLGDLHGIIAVVKIGADIAQTDWSQLFLFTIMISMDLAIINLLPWPALDGGHLAFMAFEAVRGKPMGEKAQGEIVKWGFISLIVLMVLVVFNDVKALVEGKLDLKKARESQEETLDKKMKKNGEKKSLETDVSPVETAEPGTPESSAEPQFKSEPAPAVAE